MIPKMLCARIRHVGRERLARRTPIGDEHGFPDDQHSNIRAWICSQHISHCGGPPQTSRSSRGQQDYDTRPVAGGVKLLFEVSLGEGAQLTRALERGKMSRQETRKEGWRYLHADELLKTRAGRCADAGGEIRSVHGSTFGRTRGAARRRIGRAARVGVSPRGVTLPLSLPP